MVIQFLLHATMRARRDLSGLQHTGLACNTQDPAFFGKLDSFDISVGDGRVLRDIHVEGKRDAV